MVDHYNCLWSVTLQQWVVLVKNKEVGKAIWWNAIVVENRATKRCGDDGSNRSGFNEKSGFFETLREGFHRQDSNKTLL